MVRLRGPLHSDGASGSIGGQVTFASWKGRSYARSLVVPANPQSPAQTCVRAMMAFLSQAWSPVSAAANEAWADLAAADAISSFNAYIRGNLMDWKNGLIPLQDPTMTRSASANQTPKPVKVTAGAQVTVTTSAYAGSTAWGWIVYYKNNASPDGVLNEVVGVIPNGGANTGVFVHRLPTAALAGTAKYKVVEFTILGVAHAISAVND